MAEVAAILDCDLVVNVQGDEPLIEPAMIAEALCRRSTAIRRRVQMTTLCRRARPTSRNCRIRTW